MKKRMIASLALAGAAALTMAGCSSDSSDGNTAQGNGGGGDGDLITVGFAQTGSESGWRSANTDSMKEAFSKDNGFNLIFNAADNDTAAQIQAVRSFINQGVDAIVIAPIVSDGWDDVLQEAKDANIPVILEDRTVSSSDDLFAAWVGDDFKQEGTTAGEFASQEYGTSPTKMVVLEGTTGSAPANDRAEGFDAAISGSQIEKIDSQTGDFTRDGGKQVMEGFIQKYGLDGIDLVFAHNDDMALGAIEAIEAAGGTPGTDIKIISIDGVHDGLQALLDKKINYVVECNPLLGPSAAQLVKDVLAGKDVEHLNYATDSSFTQDQITQEILDARPY